MPQYAPREPPPHPGGGPVAVDKRPEEQARADEKEARCGRDRHAARVQGAGCIGILEESLVDVEIQARDLLGQGRDSDDDDRGSGGQSSGARGRSGPAQHAEPTTSEDKAQGGASVSSNIMQKKTLGPRVLAQP